jgi:hypothetical protein
MPYDILHLDSEQRALEKQASRESDSRRLSSGQASVADISIQNDFFAALDLRNFRISSIGHREISCHA